MGGARQSPGQQGMRDSKPPGTEAEVISPWGCNPNAVPAAAAAAAAAAAGAAGAAAEVGSTAADPRAEGTPAGRVGPTAADSTAAGRAGAILPAIGGVGPMAAGAAAELVLAQALTRAGAAPPAAALPPCCCCCCCCGCCGGFPAVLMLEGEGAQGAVHGVHLAMACSLDAFIT